MRSAFFVESTDHMIFIEPVYDGLRGDNSERAGRRVHHAMDAWVSASFIGRSC